MENFFTASDMTSAAEERAVASQTPFPLTQPESFNERATYQRLDATPGPDWAKQAAVQAMQQTQGFINSHYMNLDDPTDSSAMPIDPVSYGSRENDDTGFNYTTYMHNVVGAGLQQSQFLWSLGMGREEREHLTESANVSEGLGMRHGSIPTQDIRSRVFTLPVLNYLLRVVQAGFRSHGNKTDDLWHSAKEANAVLNLQCAGLADIVESPQTVPQVTALPANRMSEIMHCIDVIRNGRADATNVYDRRIGCGADILYVLKRVKLVWDTSAVVAFNEAVSSSGADVLSAPVSMPASSIRAGHVSELQKLFYGTGVDMVTPLSTTAPPGSVNWGILSAMLTSRAPDHDLVDALESRELESWYAYQLVPYAAKCAGSEIPFEILSKPDANPTKGMELDAVVFRPGYSIDAVEDTAIMGYGDNELFSDADVHRRIMQSTRRNYALGEKIRIFVTSNGFHPEVYCTVDTTRKSSSKKRKHDRMDIARAYHDDVAAAGAAVEHALAERAQAKRAKRNVDSSPSGDMVTRSAGARRSDYDHLFKIILTGEMGVGKTSLFKRFVDNTFSEISSRTLENDHKEKIVEVDGKRIALQIWDTQGQERFGTIASSLYQGAKGIFVVTNFAEDGFTSQDDQTMQALNRTQKWIEEAQKQAPDASITIIFNKLDLAKQEATKQELEDGGEVNGFTFNLASAKTGTNVNNIFTKMARLILTKLQESEDI